MGMNDRNVTKNRQKVNTSGEADPAITFPEVQLPPQATIDSKIKMIKALLLGVCISFMEVLCMNQMISSRVCLWLLLTGGGKQPIISGRG